LGYWPLFLLVAGCGLPDYAQIDSPDKIFTGSDAVVGFTTLTDDPDIIETGYAIYYKIYRDFEELYSDDLDEFSNLGDGLLPGSTLPKQFGFVLAGGTEDGRVLPSSTGFNIPHIIANENVYINFNPTGVADSNSRAEPEVVRIDPDPGTGTPMGITLTRGYIDIEDTSSNPPLRYFVDDWRVEPDPENDYFDGDLRRPPPSSQPGTSSSQWTGTPFFSAVDLPTNIQIAVVVYSVGIDKSGGGLTFLESEPVHLGRVNYTEIQAAVR
jgi:hypothetical protein